MTQLTKGGNAPLTANQVVLTVDVGAAADLSALPAERVAIHHTFRPDRDAWAGAGYRVLEEPGAAAVA